MLNDKTAPVSLFGTVDSTKQTATRQPTRKKEEEYNVSNHHSVEDDVSTTFL
jgi:hypothetical protein